mmetsp:Transcript_54763/g.138311  ORF Transcript_54763/g.138311 Transcript_54763/m.138311 type:complete len:414 (-) Transcript_54763:54-1295(-)
MHSRSRSRGGQHKRLASAVAVGNQAIGARGAAIQASAAAASSTKEKVVAAKLKHSSSRRAPQEVEHFRWLRGQKLGADGRYIVRKLLGEGTFGRVLGCKDTKTMENVAIKVVKGVKRYCEHAEAEAEVLREILRCDPGRQSHCVQLLDTFLQPKRHFCLVFECLDVSLRDFLKDNGSQGLLLKDIRSIVDQLLQCLSFLHAINVVHTDIKCRNMLLRDSRYDVVPFPRGRNGATTRQLRNCDIVMVDFGGAIFQDEKGSSCIGTRQYRAPEVILGLHWDEKADMWSAGCLITMLYLGERAFNVREDAEHLALIQRRLGQHIPPAMVRRGASRGTLPKGVVFDGHGRLEWPACATDDSAEQRVQQTEPLAELFRPQHAPLLQLLQGMLRIDPAARLSAEAGHSHAFVIGAEIPE